MSPKPKAFEREGRVTALTLNRPVVCLGCTELSLAFETMKTLSVFQYDGIVFINSVMVHIDAAFEFAVAG